MTDTFPIGKLPVSPDQRLEFAKKLLEGVRIPPQPPKDFNPVHATPKELNQYGLPPQPDKIKAPKQAASWERLMSKLPKFKFVQPTFKIIESDQNPPPRKTKEGAEVHTYTTTNWAGAVIVAPSEDQKFDLIMADWIVPNPYPGYGGGDGTYYSSAWIGIDGWNSSDVLQVGTSQNVTLDSGKLTRNIYAWYKWYPASPIMIDNFGVSAGDTVNSFIWADSSTTAWFSIYNWSTWTYFSVYFSAPKGTELKGDSAEWIMEDSGYFRDLGIADFGSIIFRQCWADNGGDFENLANADMINLQQADNYCIAEVEDPNTILTVLYVPYRSKEEILS